MYTTPSAVCLCDTLVSLILLGWELRVSYITVPCVQGIPILSPPLFTPLYSHILDLRLAHAFIHVAVTQCSYVIHLRDDTCHKMTLNAHPISGCESGIKLYLCPVVPRPHLPNDRKSGTFWHVTDVKLRLHRHGCPLAQTPRNVVLTHDFLIARKSERRRDS